MPDHGALRGQQRTWHDRQADGERERQTGHREISLGAEAPSQQVAAPGAGSSMELPGRPEATWMEPRNGAGPRGGRGGTGTVGRRASRASRGGDEEAFVCLYRRWQAPLHRFAIGMTGSPHAAEDVDAGDVHGPDAGRRTLRSRPRAPSARTSAASHATSSSAVSAASRASSLSRTGSPSRSTRCSPAPATAIPTPPRR